MAVMLIARFDGDVDQLRRAYDRAHALIMSRGGATGAGELRHHCAVGEGALYIIGVWESEERVRTRWASEEFQDVLTSAGFPSPKTADITILELYAADRRPCCRQPGAGSGISWRLSRASVPAWPRSSAACGTRSCDPVKPSRSAGPAVPGCRGLLAWPAAAASSAASSSSELANRSGPGQPKRS